MKDIWVIGRKGFMIASPVEEKKLVRGRQCTSEGIREGLKSAAIACVLSAVTVLTAVRKVPWAKANINHTGQALLISAASIATFCISAGQNTLECAKKNSLLLDAMRRQQQSG